MYLHVNSFALFLSVMLNVKTFQNHLVVDERKDETDFEVIENMTRGKRGNTLEDATPFLVPKIVTVRNKIYQI